MHTQECCKVESGAVPRSFSETPAWIQHKDDGAFATDDRYEELNDRADNEDGDD